MRPLSFSLRSRGGGASRSSAIISRRVPDNPRPLDALAAPLPGEGGGTGIQISQVPNYGSFLEHLITLGLKCKNILVFQKIFSQDILLSRSVNPETPPSTLPYYCHYRERRASRIHAHRTITPLTLTRVERPNCELTSNL